ncbi:hypothetical protein [Brevibacillus brevis]|uniref:hypothetical protein n=1 Tax=Brevibacillus brevis TaxID=1393 RepID=UPI0007D89C55|nr:hypothetical protein [Brevibacillus brevis]
MKEKWIGEKDNISGTYVPTECNELQRRTGGCINAKRLYKFNSRFGEEYYITDHKVIDKIEEFLVKEQFVEIYEYIYSLVIEKFGMIEFLVRIGHKIAEQRDNGYRDGKRSMQQEVRKVLGI